jgi:nitrogen-specific signal transduction histidine kinase
LRLSELATGLTSPVAKTRIATILVVLAVCAVALPIAATQVRSAGFLPHWYCYLGNGPLTWTHVISDLLIGISYLAISCTLLYIVRRSQGAIPFHWLVLSFGLFIVACGATHFMEVITIWKPYYWVSAAVKVVTAGASVATAVALPLLSPTILHRLQETDKAAERQGQLENANSELARLNDELKESGKLKNALVAQQATRIGDWVWNMKSGENIWSEAVEIMHGLEPRTYDGRYEAWWATVNPLDYSVVTQAIERAMTTGEYEVEYRTLRPDHSVYWTAARGKVIYDADGKPEKMIGICMDVTGRKVQDETLLRAEKLAAAGRLAATVAHEINNPLEAVMNLIYLARNGDGNTDAILAAAERELARVSAIARQTLGFYRDTSSPTSFPVAELIDQVVELYSGKLQSKRIAVFKSVDPAVVVLVPRGDLHQVMANLMSNAIDASPIGGVVEIHVRAGENGDLTIEISDHGPGMSDQVERRLFEPFFTTKKDVGTGLGLWVSKRLVNQMGGEISYSCDRSSKPRTSFRVRLAPAEARKSAASTFAL